MFYLNMKDNTKKFKDPKDFHQEIKYYSKTAFSKSFI